MNRNARNAVLLSAVCLTFNVSPSWCGGPPNPTPSDGNGNTAGGTSALLKTTGPNNTAFGDYALTNNTTGSDNTASGYRALFSNTTGNDNTSSGNAALNRNTTGRQL